MDPAGVTRIPEFYKDAVVFITGASGFLGKALVEKLLRSCSNLERIYILMRKKKGVTPQQRWHTQTEQKVYSWLRAHRADILQKKVTVVEGDVKELRLGLSDEDYALIQETVTVIFHAAATVRFDEPVHEAILMNTRGTREVVHLALDAKKLQALVHVSTSFCNPYQEKKEEIVYTPPVDWRDAIKCAERLDPALVAALQLKYISGFPNTYTFAKNLAESIIWEYRDQIRAVIVRPSIVVASIAEPYPGYVENMNGPVAMVLGSGMHVVRNIFVDHTSCLDYVAVDEAVQMTIASAWYTANRYPKDIRVFNLTTPRYKFATSEFGLVFYHIGALRPIANQHIIFPDNFGTKSEFVYRLRAGLTQVLPAYLYNMAQKFWKLKSIDLVRIQIKVIKATKALKYFMLHNWHFPNDNTRYMRSKILPEDKDDFYSELVSCDFPDYLSGVQSEAVQFFFKINLNNAKYCENSRRIRRRALVLRFIAGATLKAFIAFKVHNYVIGCGE